jgi:hypothetical protein
MDDSLRKKLEEIQLVSLQRIFIARRTKEINHSQFADDAILLGEAFMVITERFKEVMDLCSMPRGEV